MRPRRQARKRVADPVGAGVVQSLAQPGGNATGLSLQSVVGLAENDTLDVIRKLPTGGVRMATPPPGAHVVAAPSSGYVQVTYVAALSLWALVSGRCSPPC